MAKTPRPYRLPRNAGPSQPLGDAHIAPDGNIEKNPVPADFQRAFLASKARYAAEQVSRAINAHPDQYSEIVGSLSNILTKSDPVPGGVGYGTFYAPHFQSGFTSGTEILWSAICPNAPGGNVSTILYMTATNRAARGGEALAAYDPGGAVAFRIYDWSIPQSPAGAPDGRWVFNLTGAALAPYLTTIAVNGKQYRCLPIYNSTIETSGGVWTNSVLLHSPQQGWVRQYSRSYNASLADQQSPAVGDWGPIVETFQQSFQNTNPLGASDVQLRAKQGSAWSSWAPLSPTDSTIRDDNVGFHQSFLQANYDWLVVS